MIKEWTNRKGMDRRRVEKENRRGKEKRIERRNEEKE